MQHSLYIAVARLVRYSQWAATSVFLVCVYIAVADNLFFEPVGRSLMIVVAALPPALFLIGLYFFESRQFRVHESRRQAVFSATVFFVLSAPAIFLNWRYTFPLKDYLTYFLYAVAFLFSITSLMPARAESGQEGLVKELLLHYKHVMLDVWTLRPLSVGEEEPLDAAATGRINAERDPFYSRRVEDMMSFQETLTCPELDAGLATVHVAPLIKKKQNLSVVDIGGGDGRFTAQLLHGLEGPQCGLGSVLNFDPAPRIHDMYVPAIERATSLRRPQIRCDAHGVEDTVPPLCDILIASHSLYGVFDKARASGRDDVEGELRKLVTHVRPGGVMILIMSSVHSIAIAAKRRIYHHVFGDYRFDTAAEDIDSLLTKQGWVAKRLPSDSLINLSDILRDYVEQRKVSARFLQWASYFLRCDLTLMPESHVTAIADLFYSSCFRLRQLAESVQTTALGTAGFGLHLDSLVLPHKTIIYLLKPASNK